MFQGKKSLKSTLQNILKEKDCSIKFTKEVFLAKRQKLKQDTLYNVINSDRLSQWEKHHENTQKPMWLQRCSAALQHVHKLCLSVHTEEFWFSWTQNPRRQQHTRAGSGVADWVEPRVLRTMMEQCSWSLASELSLPSLLHQTLREEHRRQYPLGEESEHTAQLSVCWTVPTSRQQYLVPPIHMCQRWNNVLGNQPSPVVTSATFDSRTLQVFLWLFPWRGSQEAGCCVW